MSETDTGADDGGTTTTKELSVLDLIVRDGRMVREADLGDTPQARFARDLISEFAGQVQEKRIALDKKAMAAAIQERIDQIDDMIGRQLDAILHDDAFQQLEATWRGLHHLVKNTETGTEIKLRVLNATRQEVQRDLDKATDFDQSALFKKVYEEEYGTFGGAPYSFLVADYEIGRSGSDVAFATKLAEVAAAAHAPLIAAASPQLFDMESFTELGVPRDLGVLFESSELAEWREFRNRDDARYLTLVLPHVLLRLPYGPKTVPVDGLRYTEDTDGRDHSKYLWGNAAWALALRITTAFAQYGWTAAIRGVEGGGKVGGLPAHTFKTDEGDKALKCPTEIAITDRRERELSELGFIALCHCKGEAYAAFFGGSTTQKPQTFSTPEANANARLSSMLPYVLAASRFAHYLKVMMRDKVGSFQSRSSIEKYLNDWIARYVLLNDDAPQSAKARFPLREARVDVTEIAGKPGCYNATVFLRPHFQLEELTASIRLVAELPPPAA